MSLFEITEEQIIDRLRFENPWWAEGEIDSFYRSMRRRLYIDRFYSLVSESRVRRATVLMGPRRVGKTVLIFHAIQRLIDEGVNPLKIFYLSIETPIFDGIGLESLFSICRKAVRKEDDLTGFYVFFDEIQYLKNWEIHLKSLVDSYHGVKFVVSGSAAAALRLKSAESGAGRFTDFSLPPLTFHEYIHLKGLEQLIVPEPSETSEAALSYYGTLDIGRLNEHFLDYINFGAYPEVSLSAEIQSNPGRYIKSDIVDKVLLRDLPSLYGIQDIQELNSLFTTIAFNTGNEFSYENLSTSSGVTKNTIKKYVSYLEAAFLIRLVSRIDLAGRKFKRLSSFKIYLTNPSLRSALFAPINATSEVMGNLVETAIYAQWFHRQSFTPYYANWRNGEVDLVGLRPEDLKPAWAVEVKWSNKFARKPALLKSLLTFLHNNHLEEAVVTTISEQSVTSVNGCRLRFIPASVYCYTIGRRTFG